MRWKKQNIPVRITPAVACMVGAVAMLLVSRILHIQVLNPCQHV